VSLKKTGVNSLKIKNILKIFDKIVTSYQSDASLSYAQINAVLNLNYLSITYWQEIPKSKLSTLV
jgi:hypothetical protein